jgi:hypothetical protein
VLDKDLSGRGFLLLVLVQKVVPLAEFEGRVPADSKGVTHGPLGRTIHPGNIYRGLWPRLRVKEPGYLVIFGFIVLAVGAPRSVEFYEHVKVVREALYGGVERILPEVGCGANKGRKGRGWKGEGELGRVRRGEAAAMSVGRGGGEDTLEVPSSGVGTLIRAILVPLTRRRMHHVDTALRGHSGPSPGQQLGHHIDEKERTQNDHCERSVVRSHNLSVHGRDSTNYQSDSFGMY